METHLMTWAAIEHGTYQHIFQKLDKPYKMAGMLISWASICGRAFAAKEPQPNAKKLKCKFCQDKENGHHARSST